MANVSLTDFGPQAKEIERRRRLAELLQEQAGQPLEIQSYQGIQAPISPFAVLAKGLQAYNARKQGEGLDEKEAEITKNKASERAAFLAEVLKKGDVVGSENVPVTAPTQASFDVPGLQPAKAALDLPAGFEQQDVVKPRTQADRTALLLQGAASGRDDISSMIPALMKAITPEEITGSKYGRYERDPMTGEVRQTQAPMATEEGQQSTFQQQMAAMADPAQRKTMEQLYAMQHPNRGGGGTGGGGASAPRFQQSSVFMTPDGRKIQAMFDPKRGYGEMDATGQFKALPEGSRPVTAGVGNPLNRTAYFKLKNDFRDENTALGKMNRYFETVGGSQVGLARLADQIAAKTKTLFGSKTLTPQELAAQVGNGQLQGLLGLFRTDIVGPGVMTEYDATRVLNALGGDFTKMQNPLVVKSLLQDIYADKMRRVEDYKTEIDFNSKYYPGDKAPDITAPANLGGTNTKPDAQGWVTLPSGVRVREKK